jgi:pimeloyl-ACP methyl ester carboxylesterase
MRLTLTAPLALIALAAACGGGSNQEASPTGTASGTTTAVVPSLDERAQIFDYDESAPLNVVEKKAKSQKGAEVVDVLFEAGDRKVSGFLVRPKGKPSAAVLWAHWYGEEPNTNRREFLPDAIALAQDGVVSLLPQGLFPWQEPVSDDAAQDRTLIVEQVIQLRRGLDLLHEVAGDVPTGLVGHDYGAMFGVLLVADKRPDTYVLMAPDATFSNWFIKYFVRSARKPELDRAFAPLEPVNNVGDAAPASVFFQFARSDGYVPGYIAERLTQAASEPKKAESYDGGHELDDAARKDRLAWLRRELGLSR